MRIPMLAAALALVCVQAQAATLQATPSTLNTVAMSAQSGDVIALTGSGPVALNNQVNPVFTFPGQGVTIDLTGLTCPSYFYANGVANLTITGGDLTPISGDWHGCINVTRFTNVKLASLTCENGSIAAVQGSGLTAQSLVLNQSTLGLTSVTGFDINNFRVVNVAKDGIDVASSSQGKVHDGSCVFGGFTQVDHTDCHQGDPGNSGIEIYNVTTFGPTQGIWYGNGGTNINIHNNHFHGLMVWGVGCGSCVDSFVENNENYTMPGAEWPVGMDIIGGNVAQCGNRIDAVQQPAC